MAALNFPISPTVGQVYTANGKSWQWNGTAWISYNSITALNGIAIDNCIIGGTTAAAGTFTNLAYTGTLTGGTGVINIGSGQLYKDSSGNLGLGVTPSGWSSTFKAIQIGSSGALYSQTNYNSCYLSSNQYYNGTNNTYINSDYATLYKQYNGVHTWLNAPSGTAGNAILFTQAMTLDASGTLLIGQTTNPATSSIVVKVATGTGNGVNAQITSNTGTSYPWSNYNASGTYVGGITCTSSATAFPTSSDERLKENVQDASDTLNALLAVKIRSFDWKIDGAHQEYGVVAQEIQPHMPEAVLVSPGEGDYLSVDYTKIVPRLVKAIQELSAELNELKAKVNA